MRRKGKVKEGSCRCKDGERDRRADTRSLQDDDYIDNNSPRPPPLNYLFAVYYILMH